MAGGDEESGAEGTPTGWQVGDRALVPAYLWPKHRCREHGGAGWEVEIDEIGHTDEGDTALVRFLYHRDDEGELYDEEVLLTEALQPLPPPAQLAEPAPGLNDEGQCGLGPCGNGHDALEMHTQLQHVGRLPRGGVTACVCP